MIGFEPGFEARVVADDVRFNIPDYLLQAALDASYAAKDHTHTADQISGLEGALTGYETKISGWAYSDDIDTDNTRFPWIDLSGGKFRTSWNGLRNKLKSYLDGFFLSLSGGTVTGRVTANGGLTHGIGGGYLNIGSYTTSSYGSGYGRLWWNENTKTLELNPGSGGSATFYTNGAIKAANELNVGSNMRITADGNVYGSKWGNQWLSAYLDAKFAEIPNGRAYPRRVGGGDLNFNWSGQGGQPTWLWGGTDGTNMYVYNPANFSVNYANSTWNSERLQGWDIAGIQNDAQGRANGKARKAGSWGQWNFTSHDQRIQNGMGENIYYTANISGTYSDTVQLQISPDNSTYWTVGTTTTGASSVNREFTSGCLPPGWWMRLIRGSGNYNANVILVW